MLQKLIFVTAILIALYSVVSAEPVSYTVQSTDIKPYTETLKGFKSTWRGKSKAFILSDHLLFNVTDNIKKKAPDVVLAVGMDALETIKYLPNIPIIYTMVMCSEVESLNRRNITGVCMQLPASLQLEKMLQVIPNIKNIGILYDPHESDRTVKEALQLSSQLGVTMMAKAVTTPRAISLALHQMKGKADAIWMLPDLTLKYPMSMEFFTMFSFENKVPLVIYSEKYMEMGAFMSIGIDVFDMGRQAGEIANRILSEGGELNHTPVLARSSIITINKNIADKFGIDINIPEGNDKVHVWHR